MELFAGMDFFTNDLTERVFNNSATSNTIPDILILEDDVDGEGSETFVLELVDPKFLLKSGTAFNESTSVLDTFIFVHRNFSQLIVSIEDDDSKSDV